MTAVPQTREAYSADAAAPRTADRTPPLLILLSVVALIAIGIGLYFGLVYAGMDIEQGEVQRIFYVHMSVFVGAFFAFLATVVGGVAYLITRNERWDRIAVSGVEVGMALGLVNLITGSIWAYPTWNTWWTWDPRLVSDAIMLLTYAAYLMLRQGIENPDTRRRFASVYGIFAYITVIITLIITRIRPDTLHPVVIGSSPQNAQGGFGLTPSMIAAMSVNMVVWGVIVPAALVWWRYRLANRAARVEMLRARALELEG